MSTTNRRETLAQVVRGRAAGTPSRVAMREKLLGLWREITWRSYWENADLVGHGLLALGVVPGDRVAVHSENRPEWLYCDVGITAIRAATVGLYPTNPSPEVLHVLRDSGSCVLFAEDQEQVDKALEIADQCPDLRHIVYLDPRGIAGFYTDARLMSFDDFLAGASVHAAEHPGAVDQLVDAAEASDLATLVYTSGTTGPPKGAMLSTGNVAFVIERLSDDAFIDPVPTHKDLAVSYLPLCHVAERLFTVWTSAASSVQVNFAESIDTVPQALREIQPTLLFGVPRIWEKMVAGVQIRMSGASRIKRANFALWMKVSRWIGRTLVANDGKHTLATRLVYGVGWVFLYRALRERLGLSRVRYAASGAAPISPEVLEFFMGIGLPMHEVYGMTENSAIATSNRRGRVKLGTVGEPQVGIELRIDEATGEILTRHEGTFVGYWNNPEATASTIDADGWLHTGDVGEWVEGTHVKITDRIKDIIITAGGKNIAPSEIENALKASPYIKEAIVIGDRRKYLTALIGIELDTVGNWAQKKKLSFTTYSDLSSKPEVIDLVQGVVDQVNTSFAAVETIKRFSLLPEELDEDAGHLTATQKVRRSAVTGQFESIIEGMYAGERA
ncbi:AMP-dependent synthetase/ligase [Aeromicrobium sp. CF3.5]|uniref:AMP-dependent synthetase/ligase n=1 Tax=Aeromicrobium sp. CF3.5 TaxID=3373078 RepID=UPI003EE69C59